MTTLYDAPMKPQKGTHSYDSDSEDEPLDESDEMANFDLDVVDDALLNPDSKEFIDHFGFKITVRTDDEDSSDEDSDVSVAPPASSVATSLDETVKENRQSQYSIFSTFTKPPPRPTSLPIKPSESYQQRQTKRHSESYQFIGVPTSPSSTQRHFDKLASKFKRFSHSDHQYDSERHLMLKQEALDELKACKEKGGIQNNSINWDFWTLVIQDFGRVIQTQMDDLRQHLTQGGIPSPLRGLVWQLIAKSRDSFDLETEYQEILKKSTGPFDKQIERDLKRTFPNHPYFMQETGRQALFNVAKAYSLFDQEVGYCQGLAFIIGCLLLHMPEEDAFCVLVKMMGKYGLRGHFTPRMESLHQHMYQLDHVFQQKVPVVHRHMEQEGVTPSMYASQWFITLYAYRCPIELAFRVIDLVLVEGTQVLIQIALALIIRNQDKILKLKFEALIDFLCHGVFDLYGGDGNSFVEDTYRVELPARFMARLAQQYMGDAEGQEDHLKRINGQLSDHIRSVEAQLRQLKAENEEMTGTIIANKMDMARNEDEKQQLRYALHKAKADFETFKISMLDSFEAQIGDILADNKRLEERNFSLVQQLAETETMMIDLKIAVAEREIEFDALKRQLKIAQR